MLILDFGADLANPIELFNSSAVSSVSVGHGHGDAHVYAVYFDANGIIGEHPTGFCQLFLVVSGEGWVAGKGGTKVHLHAGQGAFFDIGEDHSKGSESGMTAIMVQVSSLDPSDSG